MADGIISFVSSGIETAPAACATCGSLSTRTRTLTFTPPPTVVSSFTTRTITPTSGGRPSISIEPTFVTQPQLPFTTTQTVIITTSPSSTATGPSKSQTQESTKLKIILGVVIPLACLFLLACLFFFIRSRRRMAAAETRIYELRTVRSIGEMPEIKSRDGRQIIPLGYVDESVKKSSDFARNHLHSSPPRSNELESDRYTAISSTFSALHQRATRISPTDSSISRVSREREETEDAGLRTHVSLTSNPGSSNAHIAKLNEEQGITPFPEFTPAPLRIIKKTSLGSPIMRTHHRISSLPDISLLEKPILSYSNQEPKPKLPSTQLNRDSDKPTEEERQMWYERTRARLERPETMQDCPWRTSSIYSRDERGMPYYHRDNLADMWKRDN